VPLGPRLAADDVRDRLLLVTGSVAGAPQGVSKAPVPGGRPEDPRTRRDRPEHQPRNRRTPHAHRGRRRRHHHREGRRHRQRRQQLTPRRWGS